MTEKEVLGLVKDNYTTIHLYLVGIPIKKFNFEELYNDICMDRYLKRM